MVAPKASAPASDIIDRLQPLPDATVIVCSSGRSNMLAEAIEAILVGHEVPSELLVIENSLGEVSPLAKLTTDTCSYRYYSTTEHTLSGKRNAAVRLASHDVIVFADDDVIVPPTWFETIVRALVALGPGAVVTGRVVAGKPEVPGAYASSLHPSSEFATYSRRTTYEDPLATFNCASFRSLFDVTGGFDERLGPGTPYPACEDNDFGFRVLEAGFSIVFDPCALLYHRAWRDKETYVPLRWTYGRGQGAFYAKHLGPDGYIWHKLLAAWRRHARRMLVRNSQTALGEIAWFAGFLWGFVGWTLSYRILPAREGLS